MITCADLEAQKKALQTRKHGIEEILKHDQPAREAARQQIETQKHALDAQKSACVG